MLTIDDPSLISLSSEVARRTRKALAESGMAVSELTYELHRREQAVRGQELIRQLVAPMMEGDVGVGERLKTQLPFIAAAGYDIGFGLHAFAFRHYGRQQDVGRLCSRLNIGISMFDHVCDSGMTEELRRAFNENDLRRMIEPGGAGRLTAATGSPPRIRFLLRLIEAFFDDMSVSSTGPIRSSDWQELCEMLVGAYRAEIDSVAPVEDRPAIERQLASLRRKSILPFEIMLAIARLCEHDSGDIEAAEARELSSRIGEVFAISDDLFDLARDIQSGDANSILLGARMSRPGASLSADPPSLATELLDNGHIENALQALCSSLARVVELFDASDDASDDTYRLRERVLCYVRSWTANETADAAVRSVPVLLSNVEAKSCFALARACLGDPDFADPNLAEPDLAEPIGAAAAGRFIPALDFEMVNLTVYSAGRLRASVSGHGATLDAAIEDAAERAQHDGRFGPVIGPQDVRIGRLDLWLQHSSRPVFDPGEIDLGFDGVALHVGGKSAYYKPSVALTSAITNPEDLLDKLARKAGLRADAWRSDQAQIRRTTWEHYAELPDKRDLPLRLRRLRPQADTPITRADVLAAAISAARRLASVQQASGYFLYQLHPFKGEPVVAPTNYVRQAGAAFAMARLSESTADRNDAQAFRHSARRVIDALLQASIDLPDGGRYIVEPGTRTGKLGVTALILAAMQCSGLDNSYGAERAQLSEAILRLQRPDGSFHCTNTDLSAQADGRSQDFYPGEALMALCRELFSGSLQSQAAIENAFPWYGAYFRRNPNSAMVPWHVDAWRLFSDWSSANAKPGEPEAADHAAFVFEMTDWLIPFQCRIAPDGSGSGDDDLAGGFSISGAKPGFSTAPYAEALVRAFGLAQRLGDVARISSYRTAARLAIDYLFRLRIPPAAAFLFDHPSSVVGGTTKSLDDMTIRCDFDQHTITAFLAAYETDGLLED